MGRRLRLEPHLTVEELARHYRAATGQMAAAAFARLRGYLSTLRKQGHALLAALETLFTGQPLHPAFV